MSFLRFVTLSGALPMELCIARREEMRPRLMHSEMPAGIVFWPLLVGDASCLSEGVVLGGGERGKKHSDNF